jgi:hypothetical protein
LQVSDQADKIIYLHEKIMDWQGIVSLAEMGGEIVPGITLGGDKKLRVVVMAFKESVLKHKKFNWLWHQAEVNKLHPVIGSENYIILPRQQFGALPRLLRKARDNLNVLERIAIALFNLAAGI